MSAKDLNPIMIVTGGSGFVGARLALRLEKKYPDHHVIVIDNFSSGSWENLRKFRGSIIPTELGSLEAVERLSKFANKNADVKAVFHQAAITDTSVDDQMSMMRANLESFKQMLQIAAINECPLIYASTSAVYGQHPKKKMKVDEHEKPLNIYGFSKLAADNYARMIMGHENAPKIVGLRYFNVYGPGELAKGKTSSYLYQIYDQLQGNNGGVKRSGNQRFVNLFEDTRDSMRDWVHVDDVVEANIQALTAESGIYNVGSGKPISFGDLIELIGKIADLNVNCDIQYVPNNRRDMYQNFTCADISETQEALADWKPMGPKKGVKKYIQWLQDGQR
jgi:ADP-L-glycero-D-manno-heptose 6-epimerase